MLRLLLYFMSPATFGRGILNIAVLLLPLNACAVLIQQVVLGPDALHPLEIMTITTLVGLPFMAGGQMIGAQQYELHQRLVHLANTDTLTRLPNRGAFMRAAGGALARNGGVLLLLDADHFKKINDNYGHATGDQCLLAIADMLSGLVRGSDILGRVGGEEFAIFLPQTTMPHATKVGERIAAGFSIPAGGASPLRVTISVGAAIAEPHMTLDEVLRDADIALYRAKSLGRARLEVAA